MFENSYLRNYAAQHSEMHRQITFRQMMFRQMTAHLDASPSRLSVLAQRAVAWTKRSQNARDDAQDPRRTTGIYTTAVLRRVEIR